MHYPAKAFRQTLRSDLNPFAVDVPQSTVHVDHSYDVVICGGMSQQEPVHEDAETEQETDSQQQATHAYDDDSRLQVGELKVFTGDTVVSDLIKVKRRVKLVTVI